MCYHFSLLKHDRLLGKGSHGLTLDEPNAMLQLELEKKGRINFLGYNINKKHIHNCLDIFLKYFIFFKIFFCLKKYLKLA